TQPNGQTASYRYDPFGRRISKTVNDITTEFFWQGDKLVAEHHADCHRSYLYEPDSFRPLALLEGFGPQDTKPFHYQLDHLGTPQELTNPEGEIVWSAHYRAYGEIARLDVRKIDNPLRFQGQYFDAESGLHYNRHRYYNPDIGRYLTPDPVKLAGGINAYRYVLNPTGWVDPLGLSTCPGGDGCNPTHVADDPGKYAKVHEGDTELPKGAYSELSRNGAFKRAKAIGGVPQTQHPTLVRKVKITDQYQHTEGRVYIFELQERQIEIREHSLGHKKGNLGPHFNTEASIDGKSTPLKNHVDNHSYFKGNK
ncbi:RHS repeat-associated core domain-containing protein, partial [Pseudomonas fluorescens]|uniref:RHS repeat-associated core domain-containing protein n=1 Tax=Pseudomonas fluorescens TaxID=294 RepID=UPI001903A716